MRSRRQPIWQPSPDQMGRWPEISGNAINGLGEETPRRPSPVYWHPPETIAHGPLQNYFYQRTGTADESLAEARRDRQRALDEPLAPLAVEIQDLTPEAWTQGVKQAALASGADDVGVAAMRSDYVFEGHAIPPYRWMILLAVEQDYEAVKAAPSMATLVEITRQYARGIRVAKRVANGLRERGHDASPYGGPMAGSFLLIPAAIEAGLGVLGKHGSMIHRKLGSNFRLAAVLTNAPLLLDARDDFEADGFCTHCQVCSDACPPNAIGAEKVLVRGARKWYVDFDKCLPYFNEAQSCGLCLAVCPFSRPGVGENLVAKLAAHRKRRQS